MRMALRVTMAPLPATEHRQVGHAGTGQQRHFPVPDPVAEDSEHGDHRNPGQGVAAPPRRRGSSEKENPVTSNWLANVSGHSSSHAIDRVISLNVKSPKSRSLISHSMKSLIQVAQGGRPSPGGKSTAQDQYPPNQVTARRNRQESDPDPGHPVSAPCRGARTPAWSRFRSWHGFPMDWLARFPGSGSSVYGARDLWQSGAPGHAP